MRILPYKARRMVPADVQGCNLDCLQGSVQNEPIKPFQAGTSLSRLGPRCRVLKFSLRPEISENILWYVCVK